jgi:hypothetical protein
VKTHWEPFDPSAWLRTGNAQGERSSILSCSLHDPFVLRPLEAWTGFLHSLTNVRNLRKISRLRSKQGFLPEFTLSLPEGVEMTDFPLEAGGCRMGGGALRRYPSPAVVDCGLRIRTMGIVR